MMTLHLLVVTCRDPVKNQSQKLKRFNFYVQVKNTFNPVITFFSGLLVCSLQVTTPHAQTS